MTTESFVCACLGIDGEVIDRICDEFDLDLSDDDGYEAIKYFHKENKWAPGMMLLESLLSQVIAQYPELDEDKWSFDFSSPSYPDVFYDGERIHTKEDVDKIAGRV